MLYLKYIDKETESGVKADNFVLCPLSNFV